jgi:hypothetical protein
MADNVLYLFFFYCAKKKHLLENKQHKHLMKNKKH